jgi:hypothetical protein
MWKTSEGDQTPPYARWYQHDRAKLQTPSVVRNWCNCVKSRLYHFDFANTATNITTTLAGSVAFLTVADCDAGNRPFAVAAATSAAGHPLAMAFRT